MDGATNADDSFPNPSSSKAADEADRQKLWDFFVTNHNLHLLGSELNDIIRAVGAVIKAESRAADEEIAREAAKQLWQFGVDPYLHEKVVAVILAAITKAKAADLGQQLAFSFDDHFAMMDAKYPGWRDTIGAAFKHPTAWTYGRVAKEFWEAALAAADLGKPEAWRVEGPMLHYGDGMQIALPEIHAHDIATAHNASLGKPEASADSVDSKLQKEFDAEDAANIAKIAHIPDDKLRAELAVSNAELEAAHDLLDARFLDPGMTSLDTLSERLKKILSSETHD